MLYHQPLCNFAAFSMCLLTEEVSVEEVVKSNTDKAVKRSYINLRGPPAIVKGAEEYSAHVYVFPDAKLLKQLVVSGIPLMIFAALVTHITIVSKYRQGS